MDVVIRSSQGDAEVTIAPLDLDATLGEVVEDVTGRPPPRVVYVDGRGVPADASLGTSGVLVGSVLDVANEPTEPPRQAVVELVQVAGQGAGQSLWLTPGRYRIGPGRRLHGCELVEAAVETSRFELRVAVDGSVEVHSDAPGASLDGAAFVERVDGDVPEREASDRFLSWTEELLDVGGRVFALDRRDPRDDRVPRRMPGVAVDGVVAFNRPPRAPAPPGPEPLVVPGREQERRPGRQLRIPLVAVLAPLLVAVGLMLLLGSPWFLLVGLGSPALVAAQVLLDRATVGSGPDDPAAAFRDTVSVRRFEDQRWRRALHPTFAELAARAIRASPALWERRPRDRDAFQVPIGLADRPWEPDLVRGPHSIADAADIVAAAGELYAVPVVADLAGERGIGIVASPETGAALARGVMLAAGVLHGPADLDMVVLTAPERLDVWEWAKWMPHVRHGGGPAVISDPEQVASWAQGFRADRERPSRPVAPDHLTLVVVDEPALWRERASPLRRLFGDGSLPVRFVALAPSVTEVPAVCTTVITETADEHVAVEHVLRREVVERVAANLVTVDLAIDITRSLAPLDDPDLPPPTGSSLPSVVPILDLLGLPEISPRAVIERWTTDGRATPAAPLGTSERGEVVLDLVADGPHALIAGVAGSGKSELLRTLLAGLAVNLSPDEVNFLLVDFAGGSAFDDCSDLPHTVGTMADLDEHLAARLLRCLRAELGHRERVLGEARASSLDDLRRRTGAPALPRLVLVVDEIAPATTELPDLLPSLIDIAQQGRRFGFHLLVATRRPAAVVDERLAAIVSARIALRLQDDGDSLDVVGTRDAAALSRQTPGRAIARLTVGDPVEVQVGYASGATEHLGGHRFGIRPFVLGRALTSQERRLVRHGRSPGTDGGNDADGGRRSDLSRLVRAAGEAARTLGKDQQRSPCPEPLPPRLDAEAFFARHPGDAVPYGLVDLPDEQRQVPAWWHPGPDGGLVAYGIAGAGTSTLLVALGLGVAERYAPDDLHLYVIDADLDAGTDLLAPLARLPHCGAVVRHDDPDRIDRLLRFLAEEVERRRSSAADGRGLAVSRAEPTIVLLLDDVGALRELLDERGAGDEGWERFERVIRDGRPLGVCVVMTAKHERVLPAVLSTQVGERLVMRLGDQFSYAAFGLRPGDLPEFVPGRALRVADRAELQLVRPPVDVADRLASIDEEATERPPQRIEALPDTVSVDALRGVARSTDRGLAVAVGVSTASGEPVELEVTFGSAAFVTGPPHSGRSSVLVAIAEGARRADPDLPIFAVGPRGGPLTACDAVDDHPETPADVTGWITRITYSPGRKLVLVDDADRLGGPAWEGFAAGLGEECAVVIAGAVDDLIGTGHWSRPLQQTRTGVLIRPAPHDAELLRASLGSPQPRFGPGTGLVVNDGEATRTLLVDAARSDRDESGVGRGADAAGRGARRW